MTLRQEILDEQNASFNNLKEKRVLWDRAEHLFHGQLNDAQSQSTKSQIFDPKLSTLTLDRAYRVMSQLQTGEVIGISKNDVGGSKLMNLILNKYVLPNANAQFDFLTKMRMVDIYSNLYGNFFTLTDWDVRENGYIGPDVWLLNIRDVFPQVGAVSLADSSKIIIRTWRDINFFKGLGKQKDFKNISQIVTMLQDKSGSKHTRDSDNISKRDENQYPDGNPAKGAGFFEVLTRFEKDRWVDICVDAEGMEFRDIKNPHENGELPVDCKYSIPLLDDFMGMGDFERGGSMQMLVNSLWNLYSDAVKMSIFPPVLVNKTNIASPSSLKWQATAKWLVRNQINNAVQPLNLTPQGIQTFNNTFQVATSSILNMYGTTDTTVTSQTDPGMGKTPQALALLTNRQNTRDNADLFYMEQYLTNIMKKFVNLTAKKQSTALTVRMFKEEVDDLAKTYPEVAQMYDEKSGKLTVPKKTTSSNLYDYEIVSGSTFATDQKAQQDNMNTILQMYLKAQGPNGNALQDDLMKNGYQLDFGELFKRFVSQGGIQDWDKILRKMDEKDKAGMVLQNDAQKFMQVLQQMQQGQNMNAIPPQPGMPGQPQPGMSPEMGGSAPAMMNQSPNPMAQMMGQ